MLPNTYCKSKIHKNAWCFEDYGIIGSVWLEKSDFSPIGKPWFLMTSVDYLWEFDSDNKLYNHIVEASVSDRKISSLDNMSLITHWDEGDEDEIYSNLHEIILPWLDMMRKPDVFIDFVNRSMVVGKDDDEQAHFSAFGDVLIQKKLDGQRIRDMKLSTLASIYERTKQYQAALESLIKYKAFFQRDGSLNYSNDEIKMKEETIRKIDDKIQHLTDLCEGVK